MSTINRRERPGIELIPWVIPLRRREELACDDFVRVLYENVGRTPGSQQRRRPPRRRPQWDPVHVVQVQECWLDPIDGFIVQPPLAP